MSRAAILCIAVVLLCVGGVAGQRRLKKPKDGWTVARMYEWQQPPKHMAASAADEPRRKADWEMGDKVPELKASKCNGVKTSNSPEKIAFLIPSTTRSLNVSSVRDLPLSRDFMPGLARTLVKRQFEYHLYLGYDEVDTWYNDRDNMEQLKELLVQFPKSPFKTGDTRKPYERLHVSMFPKTKGKPVLTNLWNDLFVKAVNDGMDYLFMIGDDCSFTEANSTAIPAPGAPKASGEDWDVAFVSQLKANSHLGVVGPSEVSAPTRWYAEQLMVHRTHYFIFGWLFDPEVGVNSCDVFLFQLYGHVLGKKFNEYAVANRVRVQQRQYNITPMAHFKAALDRDRSRIAAWLRQCKAVVANEFESTVMHEEPKCFLLNNKKCW